MAAWLDGLEVWHQPLVRVGGAADGDGGDGGAGGGEVVVGCEVLVRGAGGTPAAGVLARARRDGAVAELDAWMWARAGEWAPRWGTAHVGVNMHPTSLEVPWVLDTVCADGGGALVVEVLESEAFTSEAAELEVAARLAEAGVGVLLDDVGSGHCDGARLARWPHAGIKLDRGAVEVLRVDAGRFSRAVRELSRGRPVVVVEGVEDDRDAEALDVVAAGWGTSCRWWAQGYAYGAPHRGG